MLSIAFCLKAAAWIIGNYAVSACARQIVLRVRRGKLKEGERWGALEREEKRWIHHEIMSELSPVNRMSYLGLIVLSLPWMILTKIAMHIVVLEIGWNGADDTME